MRSEQPAPVRLSDYRAPDFLIDTVDLDIRLDPHATEVRSKLMIRPNPDGKPGALRLDGDELNLVSVALDGVPLSPSDYEAGPQGFTLPNAPRGTFTLEIVTKLDPTANTKLMGLYRSGSAYCTQCEAEGFRRITYFLDRPDVMSVYTVRLEADRDEAPVLLANGNPVEAGEVAGTSRHYAIWHDPHPKPCYLFAVVGGRLDVLKDSFITRSGRHVDLAIYVEPGKAGRATYAMDALIRSMKWDEEAFGCEYDLDVFNIVAVSDFNMGAMENKGLNVFNDKYVLASPETATDADYAGIESVIAHEYFHNWTGNRITCRDWFQLCLKEGLTVFRDQEFTADMRSRAVKRIADVRTLRGHQFTEDAGPLAHPVRPDTYSEINNFYTATVYEKGAEVIRMLKTLIGAERFRKGMDLYFERHDGEATTIEAFIACFAEVSGRDLAEFMLWYSQAGTPELTVTSVYNAHNSTFELTLEQSVPPTPGQPVKAPMHMPVALGLLDPNGADLPLVLDDGRRVPGVIELTGARQTFTFTGITSRPVLSLNRGFSAPVRIKSDLDSDDLLFLARHDSDPFNRWEAAQTAALRILTQAVADIRNNRVPEIDSRFCDAMAAVLDDETLEPAFAAQMLTLPSETEVALDIRQDVDPDAIHAATDTLRRAVAARISERAAAIYNNLSDSAPYSPDAASAGRRSLRSCLLGYLTAGRDATAATLARKHYEDAANMTDRIAGLATLTRIDDPQREAMLEDFRRRYEGDALVLDKWLALQAGIAEAGTLARVQRLMQDPAFSLANPNRVRALIGGFAAGNPTQFHRPDGEGYRFVARFILELDQKNPQVAARLLTAFRSWRTMEAGRRAHAEAALQQITESGKLSPDVSDIVHRTLGR